MAESENIEIFHPDYTYRGSGEEFAIHVAQRMTDQATMLADHEGQLKSFTGLVSSVQASLSAWKTTAIGIASALGVAIALLGAFQIYNLGEIQSVSKKVDSTGATLSAKIDTTNSHLQALEVSQKTLPAEISQQILSIAATLSEIGKSSAAQEGPQKAAPDAKP